ncbi:MAG: hypothetical protein GJ676_02445 [Rhodobacteraceae bacterium]|nr:hypothetical protein [Paracoccaceae bacterium]
MMRDQILDAFKRASKLSDQWQPIYGYKEAGITDNGRLPVYDFHDEQFGKFDWKDINERQTLLGGKPGDGSFTMYTSDPHDTPDLFQDFAGNWYTVLDATEVDSIGISVRLIIRRWQGDAPTIRNAAP